MAHKAYAGRVSIRKMGTRAGRPHYGVECISCPGHYGMNSILAVAHLSKDGALAVKAAHLASGHGTSVEHAGGAL